MFWVTACPRQTLSRPGAGDAREQSVFIFSLLTDLRASKLHLRQERQTYLRRRQQGISLRKTIDLLLKKPRKHCPSMDRKQFFNQRRLFAHLAAPAGTFGDAGFIRGGPDRKEP